MRSESPWQFVGVTALQVYPRGRLRFRPPRLCPAALSRARSERLYDNHVVKVLVHAPREASFRIELGIDPLYEIAFQGRPGQSSRPWLRRAMGRPLRTHCLSSPVCHEMKPARASLTTSASERRSENAISRSA